MSMTTNTMNRKKDFATSEQPKPKKVAFKMNSSTAISSSFSKTNLSSISNKQIPIKSALKTKLKIEKPTVVPEIKLKVNKKSNTASEGYRFLNDGIIAECRKWERLQDRALALHEHKKMLTELRWKMVLNDNFKKLNKPSKHSFT